MEIWVGFLFGLNVLVLLAVVRSAWLTRSYLDIIDRKLNMIMIEMNGFYADSLELSDRVQELARDPRRFIEAIRLYREETGVGLKEAKETIEAWVSENKR